MNRTVRLTGNLGRDPQFRETRSRTIESEIRQKRFVFEHQGRRHWDDHDVLQDTATYDFQTTPRTFAVLSLATHRWERGQRIPTWHRIVAWNADRAHHGLRRLGRGDRVEITGLRTTFKTEDGRTIDQIELQSFRLIRRRLRT